MNENLVRFLSIITMGILLTFYNIGSSNGILYIMAGFVAFWTPFVMEGSSKMLIFSVAYLSSAFLVATAPLIVLIIQLTAVLIYIGISLVQFKNVSTNCTEEHLKGARVKYLTEMSVINLGVIATINYLKGPWWASLLGNVVTIIYYFYISDGTELVSAQFRRRKNLQDNEEQEELFGINDDI